MTDKYVMTYDLHTHTTYSHGKGSIRDNVLVAKEKGLKGIAITDHGRDHLFYGIRGNALEKMREEIEELKKEFPDIDIFLSVEANIYNSGTGLDAKKLEEKFCDFLIAGYHYGVNNGYCISNFLFKHGIFKTKKREEKLRKRNTEMIVKAINNNKIKILTHPGDKAPVDIYEIALACAKKNVLMEISTHHPHLSVEEIKKVMPTGVNFIINSDAHKPEVVGTFEEGLRRAMEASLSSSRIYNIEKLEEKE